MSSPNLLNYIWFSLGLLMVWEVFFMSCFGLGVQILALVQTSLPPLAVLLAFWHHIFMLLQFVLAEEQNQHWSLSEQSHSSDCRLEMEHCSKPALVCSAEGQKQSVTCSPPRRSCELANNLVNQKHVLELESLSTRQLWNCQAISQNNYLSSFYL